MVRGIISCQSLITLSESGAPVLAGGGRGAPVGRGLLVLPASSHSQLFSLSLLSTRQ